MLKYNWSIIGHKKQLKQVEHDLASGNLAHAYLFVGPNSVGKYTVAKKVAGILQCNKDFCHSCAACLQVQRGSHIDTIEMRGNKESIKIADVRALIDRLSMTPQSNYKVLLVQSVERMTTEAANSFLKILEEPPPKTIFLLTTNKAKALLPTIISRVRMVKFGCVSNAFLAEKLKDLYPDFDANVIKQACVFSLGKAGKALHLMENPDSLARCIKVYHDVLNFLDHKNAAERFSYVDDLLEDPKNIDTFLAILTHVLRSKVLEGSQKTDDYIKTLSKISDTAMLLGKNINSRLLLENLMLKI